MGCKYSYMRKAKEKEIQVVEHYKDGVTHVYQDVITVKWKDFKKAGIKNKKDSHSGKWFRVLVYSNLEPPLEIY
jgi:hypothetical protein